MKDYQDRFKDAVWFDHIDKGVLVIGAGGISSHLIFQLSRLDIDITVYDGDIVDRSNVAGQLYGPSHVGLSKVSALDQITKLLSDKELITMDEMYTESSPSHDVVFTGLDNMEARKLVFKKWHHLNKGNPYSILIDGRLNAETFQIITLMGDNEKAINYYKEHYLFDDDEAVGDACSYKQTSYAAASIASEMVSNYVNWISKVKCGVPYRLPFFMERNLLLKHDRFKFYK